jgi:capsular exopolysaccharide synthesis family protein
MIPDHAKTPASPPRPHNLPASLVPAPSPLAAQAGWPATAIQLAPGLAPTPTIGALLLALRRRWLSAFTLATLAAAAAVAAVYLVFPPKYVTQTRLEINSRPTRPVLSTSPHEDTDPAIFRANQKAIITSPLVLSSALNTLNEGKFKGYPITGESPESLENAIRVDFSQGPEIMQVKLFGNEPECLADLLNAIVKAYTDELDKRDSVRKDLLVAELKKQKAKYQEQVDKKSNELRDQEKNGNVADPQTIRDEVERAKHALENVYKALGDTQDDLSTKELLLANKNARLANIATLPVSTIAVRQALTQVLQASGYPSLIAAKDIQIAEWMAQLPSKSKDDELTRLNQQKKALVGEIKVMEATYRPQIEEELRAEIQRLLEAEVGELETNLSTLRNRQTRLQKDIEARNAKVRALEAANRKPGVTIEKLRDDIDQLKDVIKNLAREVALREAEPTMGSRIVILQSAETPTDKDCARFAKMATGAGLGMFGLAVFGVAFVEFRRRKVSGVEEVTQGLGLELIGTMPKLPALARRPVPGLQSKQDCCWQSIITESVDAIRTQLLHSARTETLQLVMVTSAVGGEGKTSLASQLAASLARAWRKTLLVDGDLRNPAAHKLFDLPLEPGFSEALRGESNLVDVLKPTLLSRLWLLPAGNWDAHAVQALAQEDVGQMFAQLKEQYDFIIVDSCPVLPVADTLLLAQHVDGVIFSVLRDVSRLPAVHLAQQRLQSLGVNTLGAVVIGADNDLQSLGYSYAAQAGS